MIVFLLSFISNKDTLWRLWSCVVAQLKEHIQKVRKFKSQNNYLMLSLQISHFTVVCVSVLAFE